jgi:hypothetical protein
MEVFNTRQIIRLDSSLILWSMRNMF